MKFNIFSRKNLSIFHCTFCDRRPTTTSNFQLLRNGKGHSDVEKCAWCKAFPCIRINFTTLGYEFSSLKSLKSSFLFFMIVKKISFNFRIWENWDYDMKRCPSGWFIVFSFLTRVKIDFTFFFISFLSFMATSYSSSCRLFLDFWVEDNVNFIEFYASADLMDIKTFIWWFFCIFQKNIMEMWRN